ncbi:hypothetical protein [Aggregatilinea lenta]|uniref:hypothetical protein n=1 Tax=Aggregatilinea lenta TaxID=913108 RepID=UPI000E5C01E8|nr:hypothetical protein [Aggregatilinea lenta]
MKTTIRIVPLTVAVALAAAFPVVVLARSGYDASTGSGAGWFVGAQATEPAEPPPTVTYDQPVEGAIDRFTLSQSWAFEADAADRMLVKVERLSGRLFPDIRLFDATGAEISRVDGPEDYSGFVWLRTLSLPAAGLYQIVVESLYLDHLPTLGTYRLTVTKLGAPEDTPANQMVLGAVDYDVPVRSTIDADHWRHVYTFTTDADDWIRVKARRTCGNLRLRVEMFDANGRSLGVGFTHEDGGAEMYTDLDGAGEYQIVVQREWGMSGATTGDYELDVILESAGEGSARVTHTARTVEYGVVVRGELTNDKWYEDWLLTTQGNDRITIYVWRSPADSEKTPNTLIPTVAIVTDMGWVLDAGQRGAAYDDAILPNVAVRGAGAHRIRVMRYGQREGRSTGSYEMRVDLVGAGLDSPALLLNSGTVKPDTPVEGEITAERWAYTWTYQGTAGEMIDVLVERTGGTLIPQLMLVDPEGQVLEYELGDQTGDWAAIQSFTIPSTGPYSIIATRAGDEWGPTTGTFWLTVQPSGATSAGG